MSFLSWLYGLVVWLRNMLFQRGILRAETLPGRVISVGNIAVGGTGKSPMIIAVAEHLLAKGDRPAILTRGYHGGLTSREWMVLVAGKVVAGNAPIHARPDEAVMESQILSTVPVVVGANRRCAARHWLKHLEDRKEPAPTHWLLDDGFQHRWISRDLDIVLLDADKPFGKLLPKGRFREPTESISRAQSVVFTRSQMPTLPRIGDRSYVGLIAPHIQLGFSEMTYGTPRCVWRGDDNLVDALIKGASKTIYLVSGIAQPESFRRALQSAGWSILGELLYPDHGAIDFTMISSMVQSKPAPILMTEKDWARCEPQAGHFAYPIFVLPMRASLPDELASIL